MILHIDELLKFHIHNTTIYLFITLLFMRVNYSLLAISSYCVISFILPFDRGIFACCIFFACDKNSKSNDAFCYIFFVFLLTCLKCHFSLGFFFLWENHETIWFSILFTKNVLTQKRHTMNITKWLQLFGYRHRCRSY